MRIRFSLTLDIHRDRDEEPQKQGAESSIETAYSDGYEQSADGAETPRIIGFHR